MSSALYCVGRFAASRPWTVVAIWFVVAATVVAGSVGFGRDLEDTFEVPGLDSQQATDLLDGAGSDQAGLSAQVVMTPRNDGTTLYSADLLAAVADVQATMSQLPSVVATSDPAGAIAAGPTVAEASGSVSGDGRIALLTVQYPILDDLARSDLTNFEDAVVAARVGSPLQIEMKGDLFFSFEEPESGPGELLGLAVAVVVLLVAFGSLIAMGLPIALALFGLAVGVSAMSLVTYLIEIPSWAPQIAAMIGLGVGIDDALFLVTRHREFLHRGMTVPDATGRAVATAGQAVVFAGGTVVIAILGLGVAGVPFMTAAGVATSLIVLIMVVASITLLPAFLGLSGHWIDRVGIHRRRRTDELGSARGTHLRQRDVSAGWLRWGTHVSAHAWPYAIATTVVLLALAAPVLALRLGFPDDGTQPETRTQRRAYDLVAEGFGPGINGPLVIAIDLADVADAADIADGSSSTESIVARLTTAIESDPGVAAVVTSDVDTDLAHASGVATVIAYPTTAPQDDATFQTIERLRSEVFPTVLAGTQARAHVGGSTANFGDVAARVSDRLPYFVAAVVVLSFLLLTVVFRSVLVALKAAILNLLSIGAAYGVLVMVFQWGWGAGLIGLESTVPIVSFIPMFMFAILFGLSMDYEVFLLSRVREDYLATGDNDRSVISGIAGTARVITSAALIMIAVFGGFVLGRDPVTKMFGVGLATAILVDATIVRIVLVPATMKLLGDANWWIPSWLDRVLPRIDIDGESSLPAPEMVGVDRDGGGHGRRDEVLV